MAKKQPDDFCLSLTGSQIVSARSAKSVTKRSSSVVSGDGQQRANGRGQDQQLFFKDSTENHGHSTDIGRTHKGSAGMHGAAAGAPTESGTNTAAAEDAGRSNGNRNMSADFLAFFDGTAGGSKPKVKDKNRMSSSSRKSPWSDEKKSRHRGDSPLAAAATTAAAAAPGAAACVSASKKSNASSSWYSHSVFRPDSSLSGSAFDDESVPCTPVSAAGGADRGTAGTTSAAPLRALPSSRIGNGDDGLLNNELDPVVAAAAARVSRLLSQGSDSVIVNSTRTSGGTSSSGSMPQQRASTAAQKALNAANNVTAVGSASTGRNWVITDVGGAKPAAARLSLSDMENSYLNVMRKTPVNEIRSTAAAAVSGPGAAARGLATAAAGPSVSKDAAEDYIRSVNSAATRIQRWYRCRSREKKARRSAEAAMRRMMDDQKEKQQQRRLAADGNSSLTQPEEENRRRQERAHQARLRAIEELRQKREREKVDVRQKAEEEVARLKASGRLAQLTGAGGSKPRTPKGAFGASRPASAGQPAADRATPTSGTNEKKAVHNQNGSGLRPSWADEWADNLGDAVGTNADSNKSFMSQTPAGDGQQTERSAVSAASAMSVASSNAATRTTLEDLMSTLKLLEEEEHLPPPPGTRTAAWGEDDEDGERAQPAVGGGLSEERLRKLDAAEASAAAAAAAAAEQAAVSRSTNLTDAKMRNILSFLDEVDTSNRLEDIEAQVETVSVAIPATWPSLAVPSASDLAQLEQASQAASEVANAVLTQRLELEEKTRNLQMLQKALNQQRELTIRHAKETEKEMKKRLDVQKDEYEETIKRHLSFIDQLIDDKKSLTEKCEQLVKDFKQMEKKYAEKIRGLEESHSVELAKTKEVLAASEKLKREKWIEEKTKKIKEMTVKGLEPEIQRLISKHKSELKQLRSVHEAELLQADERAGQRYVQMTEELRDQLAKEKELACQRERDAAAQRYEKQLQAEEEAYQQQRRRLYAEVQEEKERLAQQASRQRAEIDKLLRQGEDSHAYAAAAMKAEYEKAREEQERRHIADLQELKERQAVEKEAWEQNMLKKQEAWLLQRERELKEQVRRERDKEIELVIARLEEDAASGRDESERATENKIKRIRDKYENEMAELEKSEKQAAEKYGEAKAKLVDVSAELERCRALLKQKDHEIDDVKKMSEKLYRERDQVQDVVRQEFADRLVATEEENRRVKQDMAELRSKHKLEIERMKMDVDVAQKSKEEEMEEVHKRVKQAIVKKEEVVTQLKQQYQAAVKRADHLEGLLEQQRKQLLGKK